MKKWEKTNFGRTLILWNICVHTSAFCRTSLWGDSSEFNIWWKSSCSAAIVHTPWIYSNKKELFFCWIWLHCTLFMLDIWLFYFFTASLYMYMYVSARYSVVRLQYTTEETVYSVGVVVRRYVRNNVIIPMAVKLAPIWMAKLCVRAVIAAAAAAVFFFFLFG